MEWSAKVALKCSMEQTGVRGEETVSFRSFTYTFGVEVANDNDQDKRV